MFDANLLPSSSEGVMIGDVMRLYKGRYGGKQASDAAYALLLLGGLAVVALVGDVGRVA